MEVINLPVLVLVGPTAIGKTELSLNLATEFNCEIINVDSMQVYRYMDIGTAKPGYRERTAVAHHLIDIVDPDDEYNVARFCQDCLESITDIQARGKLPLLTGGTGMYLKALRNGLFPGGQTDPKIRRTLNDRIAEEGSPALHRELKDHDPISAARISPQDHTRIIRALEVFLNTGVPLSEHLERQAKNDPAHRFSNMLITGITCDRDALYRRINKRAGQMLEQGLEAEVRGLLAQGYHADLKPMQAIGYRHMVNHISGDWDRDTTIDLLSRDTRRYAKRQYTWFKKEQVIMWFNRENGADVITTVDKWLHLPGIKP